MNYAQNNIPNIAKGMLARHGKTGAIHRCRTLISDELTTEEGKRFWQQVLYYVQRLPETEVRMET